MIVFGGFYYDYLNDIAQFDASIAITTAEQTTDLQITTEQQFTTNEQTTSEITTSEATTQDCPVGTLNCPCIVNRFCEESLECFEERICLNSGKRFQKRK